MVKGGDLRVYQIKVTLQGVRPPIWRRLLVPASTSLSKLHDILQVALGWTGAHLHLFDVGGQAYGVPDPEFADDMRSDARVQLNQVLAHENDTMFYDYDFGDGWRHKIVLERVLQHAAETRTPRCIAGARACPPEDCGGVWGYADLLKAIADPSHPEHEAMVEWVGEDFDPAHFNPEAINAIIAPKGRRA
jgi:hypothetical protein